MPRNLQTNPTTSNPHSKTKTRTETTLPQDHPFFDPWNSSSTGHQRAENPYSSTVAWRETRAAKLARQFGGGLPESHDYERHQGKSRPSSEGEWGWMSEAEARRNQLGVRDIRSFMGVGKRKGETETEIYQKKGEEKTAKRMKEDRDDQNKTSEQLSTASQLTPSQFTAARDNRAGASAIPNSSISANTTATLKSTKPSPESNLFTGTTIYINGSTLPHISDHKLKHLLVAHGARISIAMARKSVTHVIVGQPNTKHRSPSSNTGALSSTSTSSSTVQDKFQGAGGGLAARKLQQEIARGGWKGVKVVGVEWALESIKAARRLAESRFAVLHVAPKGQRSVRGMFGG